MFYSSPFSDGLSEVYMDLVLPGGWRLELGNDGNSGPPWWLLGLLAALVLTLLARTERRCVSFRVGWLLTLVRLLVAGLLAVLVAEPVLTHSGTVEVPGRVIVAVDVSQSMDTSDPDRTRSEEEYLARILGLDDSTTVRTLSRREIARRLLVEPNGPLRRLARDHTLEFWTFAGSTSMVTAAGLMAQLGEDTIERESGFDLAASDWRPILAEAARNQPGSSRQKPPVVALVLVTDGRFQSARQTKGTVLSARVNEADLLQELRSTKVPVYPLMIGSTIPPNDLAVAEIRVPEWVFQDDVALVEAVLKLDGQPGQDVTVTLDSGSRQWRRNLKIADQQKSPSPASRTVVRFGVPMDRPGPTTVKVSVAVAGEGRRDKGSTDRDIRADNNSREATVQVSAEKTRVLLIESEPRWEFRYLRNALLRDPHVEVEAVVFHHPSLEPNTRESPGLETQALAYQTHLPVRNQRGTGGEADPLDSFDALVLGDVAVADLPLDFGARLERFVADRGGSLIISAGNRHWRELADSTRNKDWSSSFASLMPVHLIRPVPIGNIPANKTRPSLPPGHLLQPTSAALNAAAAWPMFTLDSTQFEGQGLAELFERPLSRQTGAGTAMADSAEIWSSLPRLPWVLLGQSKPGAQELATIEAGTTGKETVMAAQPYGFGRVFWIGTEGTWRWRYRVGDQHHHRFWGQLIRWAAGSHGLTAGNARIRFGPVPSRIHKGQTVHIQARIHDRAISLPSEPVLAARLVPLNSDSRKTSSILVPLHPSSDQPRVFVGDVSAPEVGLYRMQLEAPGLSQSLGLDDTGKLGPEPACRLEVLPDSTSERIDLTTSRSDLERLSIATGTQVFTESEVNHLVDTLNPLARTFSVGRTRRWALGTNIGSLLVIVGILTLEWITRRKLGLG